jgi:quercetin dioxygenase-like cupin family protein
MSRFYSWALCIGALFATCEDALAQVCKPVAERASELGCWIIAAEPVGNLSKSHAFWHLDVYPTSAAAKLAKTPSSTVVEAFEKTWLLTIADTGWRPAGGERVAEIGPLPVVVGETYAVQYMEAVFAPGMTAPSHTHAGPEAWYTLSGETCLETPNGRQIGRAGGEPVIIPGGPPMHLTATGTERRRALVLILHEATKPPRRPRITGRPRGCAKANAVLSMLGASPHAQRHDWA